MTVINLFERLQCPLRLRISEPPVQPPVSKAMDEFLRFEAQDIVRIFGSQARSASPPGYLRAAIRDDVPIVTLAHALASHGLTFSNHPEHGLVIHPLEREVT